MDAQNEKGEGGGGAEEGDGDSWNMRLRERLREAAHTIQARGGTCQG